MEQLIYILLIYLPLILLIFTINYHNVVVAHLLPALNGIALFMFRKAELN